MFGIVPKVIWNRCIPADDKNRIKQRLNSWLIELPDGRKGIIDTGCGEPAKFTDKERNINGVPEHWELEENLASLGSTLEEIDFVLLTHLHWDHAGGLVKADGSPSFPNAELIVHEVEYNDVLSRNPLFFKAYPEPLISEIESLTNYRLIHEAETEVLPGIQLIRSKGHTAGHVCYHLDFKSEHADSMLYTGDAVSTRHHMRMVFHPAYDLYPLHSRHWKTEWLKHCAEKNILVAYGHDQEIYASMIQADLHKEFICRDGTAII